jgi:hypothetical protein
MQLSNRVTIIRITPHNSHYVDCSGIPIYGILGKIEGAPFQKSKSHRCPSFTSIVAS